MNTSADVEAIFEFVGFRKNNLYEGYRPAHLICDNYLSTGVHSYYNLSEEMDMDKDLRGTITFISPNDYPSSIWIGKRIKMYEGKMYVGCAIVTAIFNSILDKNNVEDCFR